MLVVDEVIDELSTIRLSTTGIESTLVRSVYVRKTRLQNRVIDASVLKLKKKVITATKKGAAVLDRYIPDHIKSRYHVLQQGNEIYDATLEKTNDGGRSNKFYIIQALESDDGRRYMVYKRWGRVGGNSTHKIHGPTTSIETALDEFEWKFHAKTQNHWSERKHFVSQPDYYTWYDLYGTEEETIENLRAKLETLLQRRELEPAIAKFVSLICSADMMKKQMIKYYGYNAEKLPLRNLRKDMISKGYEVLKTITDVIGQNNTVELMQLSVDFFTIIPHNFGFQNVGKTVINTLQKLKRELQLVEALGEIEVAPKLLDDDARTKENTLLSCYQSLHCELTSVEVGSRDFNMIKKYMKNTHSKKHWKYTVEIIQIFRAAKADRFSKFSNTENRMLLWHGAPITNWPGILSQGLRMPHRKAPLERYMFGKGVYFADMFSKSANYCLASKQQSSGVLLLCEVALGEMVELLEAKRDADKLPQGKLSTKGVGFYTPDMSKKKTLKDGVVVPLGRPKKQLSSKGSLWFNEYIVYNVNQIRMRYIVHVNFKFHKQSSR